MVRGAQLFEPTDEIGLARSPSSAAELGRAYARRQVATAVRPRRSSLDGMKEAG